MRVQSARKITLKGGDIGWWHDLKDKPKDWKPPQKAPEPPKIDAYAMWRKMQENTPSSQLNLLALWLGVSLTALASLGTVWSQEHKAWGFPMRDGEGHICGIRLRRPDGSKYAVTGSRQGIFFPCMQFPFNRVFLVEGPTDVAALIDIGIYAIGRPSCSGGVDAVLGTIRRLKIRGAVIIADNDCDREIAGHKYNPGYDGAQRLAEHLPIPYCIMSFPCKDAREFKNMGGTMDQLTALVDNQVWSNNH